MSTNANLPAGAFITSINGRRCTAVPRAANAAGGNEQQQQETTVAAPQQTTLQTTTSTQAVETNQVVETSQAVETSQVVGISQAEDINISTTSTTSSTPTSSTTSSSSSSSSISPASPNTSTSTGTSQAQQASSPLAQNIPPSQQIVDQPSTPPIASEPEVTSTVVGAAPALTAENGDQSPPLTQTIDDVGSGSSESVDENTDSIVVSALADAQNIKPSQTNPSQIVATSVENEVDANNPVIGAADTSIADAITAIESSQGTTETGAPVEVDQPIITAIANTSNTSNTENTIAIVGGVVGGIAIASLIAFLLWFCRKKSLKKRRSTLLTPLSTESSFAKGEKSYVIDRRSVGPTPRSEKIRADLSSGFSRVRGRLSAFLGRRDDDAPSVNLNRGNSQFMDPLSQHSRNSSRGSSRAALRGGKLTTKDRFVDWWDRLGEDVNFNWKVRNEAAGGSDLDPFTAVAARSVKEKNAALAGSGQPDFLTLLGMDDKQLENEASFRRRESTHYPNGNGNGEHFLGGLGLNFDGRDPFSDANATRDSAKPAPLTVSQPGNPFADPNAPTMPMPRMPQPATYVNEVRRSRGSVGGTGPTAGGAAMGMRQSQADSYRESLASVDSFAVRRNKFRSDPFDLEQPDLRGVSRESRSGPVGENGSVTGSIIGDFDYQDTVRRPGNAHTRNDSFTSKYASGMSLGSLGDWSDPGPDVGPGANRWDGPSDMESPRGWNDTNSRDRRQRNGQDSVGEAM